MAEEQKKVSQPRQTKRYNDAEISLIRNTFANNDELLFALRKHFLQIPLDVIDKQLVAGVTKNKQLTAIVRKAWLPTLDAKAPIHQLVDLWMTVELKEKSVEQAYPHLLARKTLIAYLEERLKVLESGKEISNPILLSRLVDISDKDPETAYADLVARNTAIGHTEMQISMFQVFAASKDESPEELSNRLKKNSGK